MFSAVIYQRSTGPTYPFKGEIASTSKQYKYKLIRTHETTSEAVIKLPNASSSNLNAVLHYKRFQTKDSVTSIQFELGKESFEAKLPKQPAAGKMEYYITGSLDNVKFRIPEEEENENIVLRYKDPVPIGVLLPHVFLMFFAILFGMRSGLSAVFDRKTMRKWVVISIMSMTIGGMILGPIVQKYAFGEFWTGFPYGGDFTDNKTLIMWLVWFLPLPFLFIKKLKNEKIGRVFVIIAATVMTFAYLVPHSMGGSTLDYDKVDSGLDPKEAIETGV